LHFKKAYYIISFNTLNWRWGQW